ncbi:MAG TPA: UDP-N-acetylmuramoyl-tripeptide--D-alanyl-D-alanine ligase [Candidatus Dormibacteraeota bacterium]
MSGALTLLLVALAPAAWLVRTVPVALVAARMLQIEEYEDARFLRWGMSRAWLAHPAVVAAAAVSVAALVGALVGSTQANRVVASGWLVASLVGALLWSWTPAKRALVVTARMRRILVVTAVYGAALAAVIAVLLAVGLWLAAALLCVAVACTTGVTQLLLVAADESLRPVEAGIRRGYLRRARTRIAEVSPLVIAVAGSYGKTSTKHILAQLFADQAAVLPTRKSFNTLMGVTRVINEDLKARHRVFVVEMDAYATGEIAAIGDLVHPAIAVLTSVGPQHLERFGDMGSIAAALYEVVQALPAGGTAFIHAGDAGGAVLAERAAGEQRDVVRYGIAGTAKALDVFASDVVLDGSGARFRWTWPKHELQRDVSIPLLGRHQVLNVSAALAVVHRLGNDLDAAVAAAARLRPVEHRLEPLAVTGPVRVIDDSYNANPVGVHDALDVLAVLDGGAKVLVTPGLVELGAVEEAENRRYGEHAATVCDHVIVVLAKPAAALQAGLRAGGMPPDRIHVARDLGDATAIIGRITRAGDTVLFANDLPDTYLAG